MKRIKKTVKKAIPKQRKAVRKTKLSIRQHIEQKARDLLIINKLNNAVNQEKNLAYILNLLTRETRYTFNSQGINVYLLSNDGKELILQKTDDLARRFAEIRKRTGIKIPKNVAINLSKSRIYRRIIMNRTPEVIASKSRIQQLMKEFTQNGRTASKISKIYSLINVGSVLSIPLIVRNKVIGIMDISKSEPFDHIDILRLVQLSKQLTVVLQHRQTLTELQESEEKYKHIAENSIDAIVMAQENRIIYVNDAACKLSGFKKNELIGNYIFVLVAPEDRQLIARRANQRLSGKKAPYSYVFNGIRKDGVRLKLEISTSDAFIYNGKPTIMVVLRNITPEMESKNALIKSEARLRGILASMHDMVFVLDERKQFIFYHTLHTSKLYVSPEKFLGKKLQSVMPQYVSRLFNRAFAKNKTGKTDEFEYQLEIKGSPSWFCATISPLVIDKKFAGSVAVIRDITEDKKVLKDLHDSEERLRGFMESATEGFVLFDSDLNLVTTNNYILRVFDFKKEDLIGMNIVDISFRSWESGRFNEYMKVVKTGKPAVFEDIVVTTPFGDKHLNIKAFKVGSGLGMIVRDITQMARIEQALRESEERYRAIVEDQTDMICCFSLDRVLTYVNEAYCRYFNKTKDELVGFYFMNLIHEKDRAYVDKKIKELNKDNPVGILEERVIAPNGQIKWLQWINRALLDEDGAIIEYQSVGRDITSLKKPQARNTRRK